MIVKQIVKFKIKQGLVGAVFEGIGVSTGSFVGGYLMENYGGSKAFEYYSYAFVIFFLLHISIQWILTQLFGPFGKKSIHESIAADSIDEDLHGIKQNLK